MRQIISVLLIAALFVTLAVVYGGWWWVLLFPALSFLILAAGYIKFGARIFGKRSNGKHAMLNWTLLMPYHIVNLGLWRLSIIMLAAEKPSDEVAPGIWVGRWPSARVIPPEVEWVVDLTAEFFLRRGVGDSRQYTTLPTLDASITSDAEFLALAREIADSPKNVLIHCASGHGRSAALAATVVILRKQAASADEAIALFRKSRRLVGLNPAQRAQVNRVTAS